MITADKIALNDGHLERLYAEIARSYAAPADTDTENQPWLSHWKIYMTVLAEENGETLVGIGQSGTSVTDRDFNHCFKWSYDDYRNFLVGGERWKALSALLFGGRKAVAIELPGLDEDDTVRNTRRYDIAAALYRVATPE